MRPIFTIVFLIVTGLILTGALTSTASAQNFSPAGYWRCVVNAQSSIPQGNYGLDVEMQVAPNGSLFARGTVTYPQLMNPFRNVQGQGDWTIIPPDTAGGQYLYKFRMHPSNHAIISWFAYPRSHTHMYNVFAPVHNGVRTGQIETACERLG